MATFGTSVRRGLPRVTGGDPWPAGDVASVSAAPLPVVESEQALPLVVERAEGETKRAALATTSAPAVRRGLPRVPGGEPWPPAGTAVSAPGAVPTAVTPQELPAVQDVPTPVSVEGGVALRRGLPRTSGGESWPPAGVAPVVQVGDVSSPSGRSTTERVQAATTEGATGRRTGLPRPGTTVTPAATPVPVPAAAAASTALAEAEVRAPLPFPQTVFPTTSATAWNAERVARQGKGPMGPVGPTRHGPFTTLQWVGAAIVGGAGLLFAAGMVILITRWFISLDFMRDFLATFPGEYHLPETAPVGIPTWIGWQHFFNVFLMVLIIRSGMQVRHVKRPTAFWAPRNNPKGKISLSLWFHQSLDILWLVNGVIFVVLLFVTGQWMRIVPTSWEVIPNAVSAGLQYVSLDWPTENGWVNYNSLQQIAYFATVFLAAPLAAITGVRMSGIWPKNAKGLNKAYPVEWARAVHFPVMLYFVLFILVHVTLVLATGALRNLNHMYGGQNAVNWTGFWIFTASIAVIAAAWVAARPLVLAPVAKLFGNVSGR